MVFKGVGRRGWSSGRLVRGKRRYESNYEGCGGVRLVSKTLPLIKGKGIQGIGLQVMT